MRLTDINKKGSLSKHMKTFQDFDVLGRGLGWSSAVQRLA